MPVQLGALIAESVDKPVTPVFFNPHKAIHNPEHISNASASAGTIITGQSGRGKSFLTMKIAMESAVEGKTVIYYDPKNDARGLMRLADELDGNVVSWDITSSANDGSLDPFVTNENREQASLKANILVNILVGGISHDETSVKLWAIIQTEAYSPNPSMTHLLAVLQGDSDPALRAVATKLDKARKSTMSSLIFATLKSRSERRKIQEERTVAPQREIKRGGLTIITALGLGDNIKEENFAQNGGLNEEERLALGIMYLITDYISTIVRSDEYRNDEKLIIFDEAWEVVSTQSGRDIVNELLRLGRSLNTAVILATQNLSSLDGSAVADANGMNFMNNISTLFTFCYKSPDEAQNVCRYYGLDDSYASLICNLSRGICLMRDYRDRVGTIRVLGESEKWRKAFETNPAEREKIEREDKMSLASGDNDSTSSAYISSNSSHVLDSAMWG